ncbi:ABC-3 protein [Methanosalsum zhilinae DSM 4017]|uniref:ABC-3 protein n=1 Tax=Methanosalsum zhilinae (strain DSM 4017 / NBRC 107636 / OCM 62 / WeN5) TaxID=679901 RepID=F7XNU7_METZD|nr:metal ABC transporter permease [Methanosalsum zhilinae]AEH61304.1 ABC-3 protein [Methanosalsum zhilinae DSM 4017]
MVFDIFLGDLPHLLRMPFFQMALIGGCLISLICSIMGLFIVLRQESMIGDSVAHTAFGGIALGLLIGIDPILTAMVISIFSLLAISYMRSKGIAQSDSAMAIMLAGGFSLGLIIISIAGGFNVDIMDYLFGSILTITIEDMILIGILGISVLLVVILLYKELLAITFDERASRMNGIPVSGISIVFNILMGITIVLSIKVVGIILVVALLVLPALTALQLEMSFRNTIIYSIVFGLFSMIFGIIISGMMDVAAAGVIVFTGIIIFLSVTGYKRLGQVS